MSQVHRIYMPEITSLENTFEIKDANAKIISQVLRMQIEDEVIVLDGKGAIVKTKIQKLAKQKVLLEKIHTTTEDKSYPRIYVSLGALKGEKSALVLQKLTEIGVDQISFFESQHSISKLAHKKREKYHATCIEAIRQSGNPHLPKISMYESLLSCLEDHQHVQCKVSLHEKEAKQPLSALLKTQNNLQSVHLVIGPEGGFSPEEVEMMRAHAYQVYRCAPYVLRAETAAIYCASFIQASYSQGWL